MDYVLKIVLGLIIICIIFIVLREIVCWYSKINDRLEAQKRTNFLLEDILAELKKNNK